MPSIRHHESTDRLRPCRPGPVSRFLSALSEKLGLADGRCPCCSRLVHGCTLCPDCADLLAPRISGYCPHCGMIYENKHQTPMRCGACRLSPRPWGRVYFYGVYANLLRELIMQWKYGRSPSCSGLLEQLAVCALDKDSPQDTASPASSIRPARERHQGRKVATAHIDAASGSAVETPSDQTSHAPSQPPPPRWDAVIPVPLHPRRLRWRGFNQSQELARAAARHTGAELLHQGLVRTRETIPQTELSGTERKTNIKGAFAAEKSQIAAKRILLVDDVLTTGATLEECARTLKRAGAASVDVLVLARAAGG